MTRKSIQSANGVAVGPYAHAVIAEPFLYLSGQTPIDPATGQLVEGSVEAQTHQCFENLGAVLAAADLGFADVIKCNVYLRDMADFAEMNHAYATHFSEPYPARTTIGVAGLPLDARVEIEMVAKLR
jgi:2-iminobutanoate/2-iminopropanoate deaminase